MVTRLSTWIGQPTTQDTYPRTRSPASSARLTTGLKRCMLSSTLQFVFLLLKASVAAAKIETSLTPTSNAFSNP